VDCSILIPASLLNGAEMICYPGLRLQHQDCIPGILATCECSQKFPAAFFVLHSLCCVITAVSSPMRTVDSNTAGFSHFAQLTLRHCARASGAPSLRHLPEIFALSALKNFLCCMFPDSESSFQPALLSHTKAYRNTRRAPYHTKIKFFNNEFMTTVMLAEHLACEE